MTSVARSRGKRAVALLEARRVGEVAEVDVLEVADGIGCLHVFELGDRLTCRFDDAFFERVLGAAEPQDDVDRAGGALAQPARREVGSAEPKPSAGGDE